MTKLKRRTFLQYLAATGAVGVSTLFGYRWWRSKSQDQGVICRTSPTLTAEVSLPLLLLTNRRSLNPFGPYMGEILRTEGLNLFHVADLQTLDADILQQFALILLAEGPLEVKQAQLLEKYVADGGRLVMMRPDSRLAAQFGLELTTGETTEGYFQVNGSQPVGGHIAAGRLQFHGQANHYRAAGAKIIAHLVQDSMLSGQYPAVAWQQHGRGQVAFWAFDLARSVAYMRQGNPDWVNQERDNAPGVRGHDAFVDWIDLDRIAIPQADEQMRLLGSLVRAMLSDVLPLPCLWYFPDASPAMLIVTGDAHANPTANIEALLSRVEAQGGTMSIYYTPPARSPNALRRQAGLAAQKVENWLNPFPDDAEHLPTPAEVEAWRKRGHEFSLHPYVEEGVVQGYQTYAETFEAEGYGRPAGTVRTHRILWEGWVETARVQAAQGFGMNLDFYHIGPSFKTNEGRWVHGYFTGSGLPMKMVDETGEIIEVYQLLTELVDEYLLRNVNAGWAGLDSQAAIAVSQQMIDRALEHHAALATQFHFDFYYPSSPVRAEVEAWAQGTLAYAARKGLPIWSAARFLDFTCCRNGAYLHDLVWDGEQGRLTFQLLAADHDAFALTILLPANFKTPLAGTSSAGKMVVQVEVDGLPVDFAINPVAGEPHAWISVSPGQHTVDVWYADP